MNHRARGHQLAQMAAPGQRMKCQSVHSETRGKAFLPSCLEAKPRAGSGHHPGGMETSLKAGHVPLCTRISFPEQVGFASTPLEGDLCAGGAAGGLVTCGRLLFPRAEHSASVNPS